jgi:hypothetical protein
MGFLASLPVIHQEEIGLQLLRQQDGFPLPWIQVRQGCSRRVTHVADFQPWGRGGQPGADLRGRLRVLQFFRDGVEAINTR